MKNLSSSLIKIFFLSYCILIQSQASSADSDGKFHICFFELDNTTTSQNFLKKNTGTTVHKYTIKPKEKGRDAFKRMIEEGQRCDSLVFSGHHTGDWFGTKGSLFLKDMEELSCNEKYRDWFKNIKALWLDGCNTATDKWGKAVLKGTKALNKSSDSELVRVLGKEVEDKTTLNDYDIRTYAQSYTAALDENTPLSSRYLRMFPDTQVYGFNGAAPSGQQQYGKSAIFDHLTKLGKAIKAEDIQSNNIQNKNDLLAGIEVLLSSDDSCDSTKIEKWEEIAGHQALEHQDYTDAYKLACDLIKAKRVLDDPKSLEAAKALAKAITKDPSQYNARVLQLANSILKNPENPNTAIKLAKTAILKTLKAINTKDKALVGTNAQLKYSHLLFNNIYDTWKTAQKYKTKDSKFFNAVKEEFQTDSFTNSLATRIKSKYTASLKKGDYIKFYAEIHNVTNLSSDTSPAAVFLKEHIDSLVKKASVVFKDLRSSRKGKLDTATKRTLSASVVDQLLQYDLLTTDQINQLLLNTNLFPPETDHLFVRDVRTKLEFKQAKQAGTNIVALMLSTNGAAAQQESNLRIGTKILLTGDSPRQEEFRQLMDARDIQDRIVLQVLHQHLHEKSKKEKLKYLLDLSKIPENQRGTDQKKKQWVNLQQLVYYYAFANLEDKGKDLCDQVTKDSHPKIIELCGQVTF